jgi:hypothetical protein
VMPFVFALLRDDVAAGDQQAGGDADQYAS